MSIDSTWESAQLSKVLDHCNTSYIKKDDNTWAESSTESLKVLLSSHIPGCLGMHYVGKHELSENTHPCNIEAELIMIESSRLSIYSHQLSH